MPIFAENFACLMKSREETIDIAKKVLQIEADTVVRLQQYLSNDFYEAVKLIYSAPGRVIITGIGKSAIIANKIVATLNSTGTPAIFMHAADAIHGDLGMLQKNDIVICISNSGNTPEIKLLIPWLKKGENKLIAIVGKKESYLAQEADFVLYAHVDTEACPNNLAPTSSTTAQLALGDALAVCLLEWREFSPSDFARFHPGGSLGKRLYLRVSELYGKNEKPQVLPNASLEEVILEISSKRLGATAVVEANGILLGVVTDGDLRRALQKEGDVKKACAKDIMTANPKTIRKDAMATEALDLMGELKITQLIVTDNDNQYLGIIHIHDLNREGLIA